MTEKQDLPYRSPTRDDVTCRLVRQGPKAWAVHVGDRDEPLHVFDLKRKALAYMERRERSDAAGLAMLDARDEGDGIRATVAGAYFDQMEPISYVAGMRLNVQEQRRTRDGARVWTVTLDGRWVLSPWAYIVELPSGGHYVATPGRPSTVRGTRDLKRTAELVAEHFIQERLCGRV